jgi:eukaryotic-like serine/threonine-protein kinase
LHKSLPGSNAREAEGYQGSADASHLDRFIREARTAAGLHHTNIVPALDVGQIAGIPYYAVQYIEGRSPDLVLRIRPSET